MNNYVPRFIDFGTIAINTKGHKEILLKNIITLPFEFELVPVKVCNEIQIGPLYGEIEAVSNKTISFTFAPESYGLFISEYEFRLSEFEYKPFLITITGNCNIFDKVLNENILIHMKKQRERKILSNMKSSIASLDIMNNFQNMDNISLKTDNKQSTFNSNGIKSLGRSSSKDGYRTPKTQNMHDNDDNYNLESNAGGMKDISNLKYSSNNKNDIMDENGSIKKSRKYSRSNMQKTEKDNSNININYNNTKENHLVSPTSSIKLYKNRKESEIPIMDINKQVENNTYFNNDETRDLNDYNSNLYNSNYNNNGNTNNTSIVPIAKDGIFSRKFKSFPSTKERDYLQYYNQVESTIKDKEIKYLKFIGKKLLTDEQTNKIISERIREFENNLSIKRNIDLTRFKFELDSAKTCVNRLNHYYLKPTFNFNYNDKFFKTRHYYKLFLKMITKIVIRKRADINMNNLKKMINDQNIKNAKDFSDYVERDWVEQLTKDEETQESKMKIKFIKPPLLARSPIFLAYDYNMESLKQEIAHENNLNLEELYEYQKLDPSDVEIYGYKGI